MSLPFETEDALRYLGIEMPKNRYMRCPFCNSRKGKPLNWNYEKAVYRCNKNPMHNGNILTFTVEYTQLMGIPNAPKDTKEAYKYLLNGLNMGDAPLPKYNGPDKDVSNSKPLDVDKTNLVYSRVLNKLSLSTRHKENLLSRGFTDDEISLLGYKSLENMTYTEIFDFIKSLGIDDFSGVPWFYTTDKGFWNFTIWKKGIIQKYLDYQGRIQMLQVRIDDEERASEDDIGKCYYLSSRPYKENGKTKKKNGTAAKQCVHFACDFIELPDGKKMIDIKNGVMTLTEGAMKGDLYHAITGMPTIAVPGVHCIEALKEVLPKLKELGVYRIRLGYDMDRVMNINVLEALYKMKTLIEEYGIECSHVEWSIEYINFDGTHEQMDAEKTFIFSSDTFKRALEEEKVKEILERAKKLGINDIFFAYSNKEEAIPNKNLYSMLVQNANGLDINLKPVFWKLNLKGIDDLYAYEVRNIYPR